MRRLIGIVVLGALFTGCYIDVDDDWEWWDGGLVLINRNFYVEDATGNQMYAASAYRPGAREFLVVYQDFIGGSYDIYGVVIRAHDGVPVSSNFVICNAVNDQTRPSVVYNSTNDEYFVVWEDLRSGVDYDIYGARVDATTCTVTPLGSPISALINRDEREPKVAYDDIHNRYLVVWDEEDAAGYLNIYGRILSDAGSILQDVNICSVSGNQQSPHLAFNPYFKEYLVVWMDFRYHPSESDVFGRFIGWNGNMLTSDFAVCDDAYNQDFPWVAFNSIDGEYLVIWEDDRNGDTGVWGRLLNESGAPIGASYTIFDDGYNQRYPQIAYNSGCNEYLVVWEDDYYGNIDIFGIRLDRYGVRVGRATLISDKDVSNLRPAPCANTDAGEWLTVWHARITTHYDIVGQLIR